MDYQLTKSLLRSPRRGTFGLRADWWMMPMRESDEFRFWIEFVIFVEFCVWFASRQRKYVTYTVGQAQRQYGSGDRNLGTMANRRRAGGAGFFALIRCSFWLLLLLFIAPVTMEPSQRICVKQIKTVKHKRTQMLEKCSREKTRGQEREAARVAAWRRRTNHE